MKLARIFSKQAQPIDRWAYGLGSITFLGVISELIMREPIGRAELVFNLILAALFVLIWPLLTIRRLIELRLSSVWIAPLSALLVLSVVAGKDGHPILARVGLGVEFFVLVPLVFLPPRAALTTTQTDALNGPHK